MIAAMNPYQQAQDTKPQAHKGPLQAFSQSPLADYFHCFLNLQQPDPTVPLPTTPNFHTLIIEDKNKAINSIQDLKASNAQIIVYSNGSRIPEKNTAAAAWCNNNKHSFILQLGKESDYGIFEAEFAGLTLALCLAKHSFRITTQQVTLVIDNQSVFKDMSSKKTSSRALSYKIEALYIIKEIKRIAPHVKIVLQWCPGHEGIEGNKTADKLANSAAEKPLRQNYIHKPTFASFRLAIKRLVGKRKYEVLLTSRNKKNGIPSTPKTTSESCGGPEEQTFSIFDNIITIRTYSFL